MGSKYKKAKKNRQEKMAFICEICLGSFTQKSTKDRHVGSVHGDTKITCDLCEKTFGLEQHLKRHMEAVHLESEYKCDLCDFTCSRKDSLTRHKTIKHGIQKRASTINIENYAAAPKIAKVEKDTNFACQKCPAIFRERKILNRHINSIHGENEFSCDECDLTFNRKDVLKRHQAKHTKPKKTPFAKTIKEKEPEEVIEVLDHQERSAFQRRLVEKKWYIRGEKDILETFRKYKERISNRVNFLLKSKQFKMDLVIQVRMFRADKDGNQEDKVGQMFYWRPRLMLREDQLDEAYDE